MGLFCLDGRPHLKRWPCRPPTFGLREPGGGGGLMKKHETKSTVLLKHHLKALKLPTMTAECEKVAARCAKENVDHLGFLLQLCELELLEREAPGGGAAAEGGAVPDGQDAGRVRLRGRPVGEQAADPGTDAV